MMKTDVDAQGQYVKALNLISKCSKSIRNNQFGMYPAD
jgi:hypothetical protein